MTSAHSIRRDDLSKLPERAERLGIQLDVPQGAIAIFFSNFRAWVGEEPGQTLIQKQLRPYF